MVSTLDSESEDLGSNPGRSVISLIWGISSIGRARALQARGNGIETRILHLHLRGQLICSISLVVRTPVCGTGNPGSNPG